MAAVKRFFSSPALRWRGPAMTLTSSDTRSSLGIINTLYRPLTGQFAIAGADFPLSGDSPAVTLQVLEEAHSVGIPAVWLQPGTFNDQVLEYAHSHFEAVIAGDGGRGGEGWCVLVDGDEGLEAAGVQWTSQRL